VSVNVSEARLCVAFDARNCVLAQKRSYCSRQNWSKSVAVAQSTISACAAHERMCAEYSVKSIAEATHHVNEPHRGCGRRGESVQQMGHRLLLRHPWMWQSLTIARGGKLGRAVEIKIVSRRFVTIEEVVVEFITLNHVL